MRCCCQLPSLALGLRSLSSLRVIAGPLAGETIEIDRPVVIGRYETDVVIDDPELSRRHLEIRPDGEGLIVEDLSSTNGTFVDDHPISAATPVGHGAKVKFGTTVLEVEIVADVGATRLSSVPVDPNATRLRSVPVEAPVPVAAATAQEQPAAPPPAQPPVVEPVAAPALEGPGAPGGQSLQEFGAFSPPATRRGGGLASRSWAPVVLSYGSVILTAIALVVYFAQR
jgi:pSer/pThr/pTyr-binding forkhead associated (FHA) protein